MSKPIYYTKRPVTIQAMQLTDSSMWDVWRWIGDDAKEWCWDMPGHKNYDPTNAEKYIVIHTLEGEHRASEGDYVIKGVKGEFYPCKPDIFAMTYEQCPEAA